MLRPFLIICTLCSGCVLNEDYPDDWPPMADSTEACPDISGTFADLGLSTSHYGGHSLSRIFSRGSLAAVVTQVAISQPDDQSILVEFFGIDGSWQGQSLLRNDGDYSCEEGRIWISETEAVVEPVGNAPPAIGVARSKTGFARASDGSLVGEVRDVAAGVVFVVVPFGISARDYSLWPAADPVSESK